MRLPKNFILPISHDEVVYGKRALLDKMPGDEWQRFANARAFLSYMWGHPGKKLVFMGCEIGQTAEWNSEGQVEWWLLEHEIHRRFQTFCAALNGLYGGEPALYEVDFQPNGFEWIDFHDGDNSMVSFVRRAKRPEDYLVFVCNLRRLRTRRTDWVSRRLGFTGRSSTPTLRCSAAATWVTAAW